MHQIDAINKIYHQLEYSFYIKQQIVMSCTIDVAR